MAQILTESMPRPGSGHKHAKQVRALFWRRKALEAAKVAVFRPSRRSCL